MKKCVSQGATAPGNTLPRELTRLQLEVPPQPSSQDQEGHETDTRLSFTASG